MGCLVAAGVALFGALVAAILLPAHPLEATDDASESFDPGAKTSEVLPAAPLA